VRKVGNNPVEHAAIRTGLTDVLQKLRYWEGVNKSTGDKDMAFRMGGHVWQSYVACIPGQVLESKSKFISKCRTWMAEGTF
jgi:hypothetical protein